MTEAYSLSKIPQASLGVVENFKSFQGQLPNLQHMNKNSENQENKKTSPQKVLDELRNLDQRLERLQKRFTASRWANEAESIFTQGNIEQAIELIKKIDPTDTALIEGLKSLLPFARISFQKMQKKEFSGTEAADFAMANKSQRISQLKTKIPQNKII